MTKVATNIKAPEEYLKQPYARLLIPEEEGGYSAEILEFPGCYSQGDTAEEALQNIEEAARNWIEATMATGNPIPSPSTDYEHSGKVALRLSRSLHKHAIRLAERDGVSLNQWLNIAVAARIGAEGFYNHLAERIEHSWASAALAADNRFHKVLHVLKDWVPAWSHTSTRTDEGAGTDRMAAPTTVVFRSETPCETVEVRE